MTLRTGSSSETLVNASGDVQHPAKPYRVTVNNFMANGGDSCTSKVTTSQHTYQPE